MPNYFAGLPEDMGRVSRLSPKRFDDLCAYLQKPIRLALTREQLFALSPKERQQAKRVAYLTPAEFKTNPSQRLTEHAVRCNLICLDIDSAEESKRLLSQRWDNCLGSLGYIVWKTVSSTEDAPRLRVLVSANGILPERYVAAARTIAEMIGLITINAGVTFHAVQPMFYPTVFADTPKGETPIVACNAEGEPFSAADILEDPESAYVDSSPAPSADVVADLAYLRAPMEGVTLEDVRQALEHLDPDMAMQPWIEVAAGIKHQFDSKEGYALWNEWSAKGKKYTDGEETLYRWNTLKAQPVDRAPVTIRSVFKQAQARGWQNPALAKRQLQETLAWIKAPQRSSEELLDQGAKRIAKAAPVLAQLEKKTLIVALRDMLGSRDVSLPLPDITREVREIERNHARATGLLPWAKGICYVTSSNLFYRHTTGRSFAPEVLDLMYSIPPVGDDKPPRPRDYVVQVAGCAQVEDLRYDPAQGDKRFFTVNSIPYVNTYRADYVPADVTRADEAGDIVLDHLSKLVREPEYQRILLSYMAYIVQNPGKKIRWAPLLQSGEGAGKTALHAMLAAVLGRRNVSKISGNTVMKSQWNDWAVGHQVVTIEEVRIIGANRHAIMDNLKPLITDDDIGVERRHRDHTSQPNITNYLLFTNYHDALAIREDGRRYFVLSSPIQQPHDVRVMGGQKYFDRLYGMIRDNPGGLRAWFENYTLDSAFAPEGRAPVTPYLREFAANAASPLAAAVADCIEDEPHPLVRHDLVSLGCLRGAIDSTHLPEFTDQALAAVLREMGWEKHGNRVTVDGAKHQFYTKRPFKDIRGTAEARLKFL